MADKTYETVLLYRSHAIARKPTKRDREKEHEHDADPEHRRGNAEQGQHGQDVVDDAVLLPCGDNTENDAEDHRDDERDDRDEQSVRETLRDHVDSGLIKIVRSPEITLAYAHKVVPKLNDDWIVQSK